MLITKVGKDLLGESLLTSMSKRVWTRPMSMKMMRWPQASP